MGKITLDADTFRALASSTRLTVLKSLDERRKTLTELSRDLALNKATVHEHMALLTAAGLVKKRDDEGRKWIYYELTWTGQRILHPEATTTFNLLLALSVAAAGGGVAMLGKALGWWFEDTIASRQSDGAETQQDTELNAFSQEDAAASDSAPMAASGSDTATGTPAPAAGGSTGTSAQSTGPQSTSTQTASGAQTGAAPEGGSGGMAYDRSTGDQDMLQAVKSDDGDGDVAGGDGDAGLQFFDDGGWIGLALLLTCALFLGLALVLQRKFVPKPLDESSAAAAERGAGGQGPGGPPSGPR